ncbi:hypothetical protein LT679_01890 [Mucilaginibacter roseus]|uniref:LPS export ABC transporter periplasmic protein LptC n=1 Tax=Mucilaginibacter roseus TaxID=1528868 RepID=A0ABS8TZV8_9SPHI|nr:hypothetical protein [Mucilaginibacter roseus]MCD8739340.1 hypothetical protein [Mucilaginibacter roseus]
MKNKHLLVAALLIAGCGKISHDGIYVSHIEGEYSIVDDTLIIKDSVVINHSGYQKIRNGVLQEKQFKANSWLLKSADAPAMHFSGAQIILGQSTYTKLP